MLSKAQILKKLKKYGYYSLNRAPYLFRNDNEWGVYFVWPHKYYGTLDRVMYFETEEEVEKAIFEYWWFNENKNKYDISIEFDDYETLTPNIIYRYNEYILNEELMKNFNSLNTLSEKKEYDPLKRTAEIIILIIGKKFEKQIKNFDIVSKLSNKLDNLQKDYDTKIKELDNKKENVLNDIELLEDNQNNSEDVIKILTQELNKINDKELIINFIDALLDYMKSLDMNVGSLQNNYLIIKYQYEINDYKKKLDILNNLKTKKRSFKNKKNVLEELNIIDEKSSIKTMIDIDTYIKNEQKRIEENYNDFKNIEREVLGDYLINFEKLDIDVPFKNIEIKKTNKMITNKEIKNIIREKYDSLNDAQKSACIIANSFLKDVIFELKNIANLDNLKSNEIEDILTKEEKIDTFKKMYKIVDNFDNINIRVKYMKLLKTSTFLDFLNSLKEVVKVLKTVSFVINEDFDGYYIDSDTNFINISLKNVWSKNKKNVNIVKILNSTVFYYSPITIKRIVDVIDSNEIIANELENVFIFKNEVEVVRGEKIEKVAIWEKDNIIKEKDYVEINEAKLKNLCSYNYNVIKNREQL